MLEIIRAIVLFLRLFKESAKQAISLKKDYKVSKIDEGIEKVKNAKSADDLKSALNDFDSL